MRKKRDMKETLKKTVNVIKKLSDAEAKKTQEKKKNSKPKGMGMKKLGVFTFWTLFLFMFLVVIVNVFGSNDSSETKAEINAKENVMQNQKAIEFSKDFVSKYFTWSNDRYAKERRMQSLSPYFLDGIDELGGLVYDNTWISSIDKRDIVLKDIVEISEHQARYVFKVIFTLKSPTDEKDTEKLKNPTFEEMIHYERKMKVNSGFKVKTSEKYISVPVYYDEENNRYAIYELPSFTYINENKLDNSMKNNKRKLVELRDSYVENNLVGFLNTFFESYTKDGRDKLNYILEDEQHQDGLSGTMEFSKINNTEIYATDEELNKFVIDAEVVLMDPSTKIEFKNAYSLVVKRKEQRYVVESLNNEKAINEIIKNHKKDEETDSTEIDVEDEGEKDFNYQEEFNSDEIIEE